MNPFVAAGPRRFGSLYPSSQNDWVMGSVVYWHGSLTFKYRAVLFWETNETLQCTHILFCLDSKDPRFTYYIWKEMQTKSSLKMPLKPNLSKVSQEM